MSSARKEQIAKAMINYMEDLSRDTFTRKGINLEKVRNNSADCELLYLYCEQLINSAGYSDNDFLNRKLHELKKYIDLYRSEFKPPIVPSQESLVDLTKMINMLQTLVMTQQNQISILQEKITKLEQASNQVEKKEQVTSGVTLFSRNAG